MLQQQIDVNSIIDKILDAILADKLIGGQDPKFKKSDPDYIISLMQFTQIQELESAWIDSTKGVTMIQFIRIFLNVIHHQPDEKFFLVMGLIELVQILLKKKDALCKEIYLQDVTSYICGQGGDENPDQKALVPQNRVPEPTHFQLNKFRVREIDINAPKMHTQFDELKRLEIMAPLTDSMHHSKFVQNGVYVEEMERIITLDNLSNNLNVYNMKCQFQYHVQHNPQAQHSSIILDFAWSSRQQRLGIALKSHTLCFFDSSGQFYYSKSFQTVSISQEYQSRIWYLPNYDAWLTTDATSRLYHWDLTEESVERTFKSPRLTAAVIAIQEILHLKLLASASMDRQILIWDWEDGQVRVVVPMVEYGGVHGMAYSYAYQTLVACGYSKVIPVFTIDAEYYDCQCAHLLQGHMSMLTAIVVIGSTPMLCSSDDQGVIKLWDMRTSACLQTLCIGKKTQILTMIDVSKHNLLCFLGGRVNLLKFQSGHEGSTPTKLVTPISMTFNAQDGEFIIACQQEVQVISVHTGRAVRVIRSFLQESTDEVLCMNPNNQFTRFVCGDTRGNISMHSLVTGEKIYALKGHHLDAQKIVLDCVNHLLISVGGGSLIVQREVPNSKQSLLRECKGIFREVSVLLVSVNHNLVLICSSNQAIFIEYEVFKILGELRLPSAITAASFMSPVKVLCISTVDGLVYFIAFNVRDQSEIYCDVVGMVSMKQLLDPSPIQQQRVISSEVIKLQSGIEYRPFPEEVQYWDPQGQENQITYAISILMSVKKSSSEQFELVDLFLGTSSGLILQLDASLLLKVWQMGQEVPANKKLNYNPYKIVNEDYSKSHCKGKQLILDVHQYVLDYSYRIVYFNNSKIEGNELVLWIEAQRSPITYMSFIQIDDRLIITAAMDGSIKLHNLEGRLMGSLNTNHPLPLTWNILYTQRANIRKKVVYAFKVIDILQKQGGKHISGPLIGDIQQLWTKCIVVDNKPNQAETKLPQIKSTQKQKKVILMKDEYSPREIRFDELKNLYKSEIQGMTLQQMDQYKSLYEVQQAWKKSIEMQALQEQKFKETELEKQKLAEKRGGSIAFLDERFHDRLNGNWKTRIEENDFAPAIQKLNNRMTLGYDRRSTKKDNTQPSFVLSSIREKPIEFMHYASQKNLTSGTTSNSNSISMSFMPSQLVRNIKMVDDFSLMSNVKWMNEKKKQRNELKGVLTNMNERVKLSKNNLSIIKRNDNIPSDQTQLLSKSILRDQSLI